MNIYESIADLMKEGYAVQKNKRNSQQGFQYRGIDDVMNTFQPLMASRGLFVVPEVLETTREERQTTKGGNLIYSVMRVKYTFYAEDGSSVSAVVIGEGMDSGDKASNKAMSAAMKYAMFQVFCIPTEEMQDPDAESHEVAPKQKNIEIPLKCEECGSVIQPCMVDGKVYGTEKIVAASQKHYGRNLCWDCMRKMKEA